MADLEDMQPVYDERVASDVCALPPPLPSQFCCANCAFMRSGGADRDPECHRFAQRPVTGSKSPSAVWPKVLAVDWCGDYKVKGLS